MYDKDKVFFYNNYLFLNSQKIMAAAAATFKESTPSFIGIFATYSHALIVLGKSP